MKYAVLLVSSKLDALMGSLTQKYPYHAAKIDMVKKAMREFEQQIAKYELAYSYQSDLISRLYYANDYNASSAEQWRAYALQLYRENDYLRQYVLNVVRTGENDDAVYASEYVEVYKAVSRIEHADQTPECYCYFIILKYRAYPANATHSVYCDDESVAELLNSHASELDRLVQSI